MERESATVQFETENRIGAAVDTDQQECAGHRVDRQ
jgi:hypothetical protein